MHTIESTSSSWTRSTLTHHQVIQRTKAKVRVYSDSVLCLGMLTEMDGKVKWKNPNCALTQRIAGNRWRNQLNLSETFSQDFRHWRFFRKSRMMCENETLNLKNSQTGSSSCQCSTTSIGQEKENVKECAKRFSEGHWTLFGPGDEKKWYGTLPFSLEGKWDSQR